jgi:hypothetical protein
LCRRRSAIKKLAVALGTERERYFYGPLTLLDVSSNSQLIRTGGLRVPNCLSNAGGILEYPTEYAFSVLPCPIYDNNSLLLKRLDTIVNDR